MKKKTFQLDNGGEVVVRVSGNGSIPLVYLETLGINETFEIKLRGTNRLLDPYLKFCTVYHIAWPGVLDARPLEVWKTDSFTRSVGKALDGIGLSHIGILMGHSTGAVIAMKYAALYPGDINLLVLSSPPLSYDQTPYRRLVSVLGKLIDSHFVRIPIGTKRNLFGRLFCTDPKILEGLGDKEIDSTVIYVQHMLTSGNNFKQVNSLRVPTVLLFGTNDRLVPGSMFLGISNPNINLVPFEKTGHVETLKRMGEPAVVG